jgi:hypothetical protein
MAYESNNIIVGAAKILVADVGQALVEPVASESYADTLEAVAANAWTNIGYTSNGLELQFAPEFGEVQVDQVLDVAKMFKSGMTVTLNTTMAESTLENLAFALASSEDVETTGFGMRQKDTDVPGTPTDTWTGATKALSLSAGQLGDCPVEKALVAVGPGPGECTATSVSERIYTAFRVLSIESVTISAKRDEASMFDVSFRLLPDSKGYYGQIVDRTWTPA